MVKQVTQVSTDAAEQLIRIDQVWDPPPPWIRFNEEMLRRFTEIELDFKQREMEIQMEKLQALRDVIRR